MQDIEILGPAQTSDLSAMVPQNGGGNSDTSQAVIGAFEKMGISHVMAQRAPVPRNLSSVKQNLMVLAQTFGMDYVYQIPFKDKKKGITTNVEGPSIKLAMDLAREYRNCDVSVVVQENPSEWVIYARFIDLENGFSVVRPFRAARPRSDEGAWMKDSRFTDMQFQAAVSKAIRNVIVNALRSWADLMVDEAKNSIVRKLGTPEAKDKALAFIDKTADARGIPMKAVEARIGKVKDKWTVQNLAEVYTLMKAIHEGMADPEEAFNLEETGGEEAAQVTQTKRVQSAPKPTISKTETVGLQENVPAVNNQIQEVLPAASKVATNSPAVKKDAYTQHQPLPQSAATPAAPQDALMLLQQGEEVASAPDDDMPMFT